MMNDFLAQVICGARWPDFQDNGWVQLLVFVIVAVIYALGSIVKAKKGSKAEGQEQGTPSGLPRKAGQRLPAAGGGMRKQRIVDVQPRPAHTAGGPQTPREVTVRPAAEWTEVVGQILEAVTGQAAPTFGRSPAVSEAGAGQPKVSPVSPPVGQAIEPAVRTPSKPEGVPSPSELPVPAYLAGILSDYADPEKVRKVILHYEILGKPLSLRESPENIIGS
jgi:hypothetical protein